MKSGFTLIELLIVVAIIAILAAIAVPNFLQAQVRAKIARLKNDQRNLAGALEAYYIDHKQYPPNNNGITGGDPAAPPHYLQVLPVLSTPTAYISLALIEDPFGREFSVLGGGRGVVGYVNTMREDAVAAQAYQAAALSFRARRLLSDHGFFLYSGGPDRITRAQDHAILLSEDADSPSPKAVFNFVIETGTDPIIYDPSNGTVSEGDILRSRKGDLTPFLMGVGGL